MHTPIHAFRRTVPILLVLVFIFPLSPLFPMTQILPDATVEGKSQHIVELIGTFDHAQEAIRAQDLDRMMVLYAQNYDYRGLTKAGIRQIWADLFSHYDFITNIHTFSAIKVGGSPGRPTAEITCTGSLWANSVETNERIAIDSWNEEVHYLVREEDGWRIVGNLGGKPVIHRFGSAPHPLF